MRWPRYATRGGVNYGAFDRIRAVHFLIGVGYGVLGLELWVAFALAITWETVEDVLKALVPIIFPHDPRDTICNAVGGVVALLTRRASGSNFIET